MKAICLAPIMNLLNIDENALSLAYVDPSIIVPVKT